MLSSLFNKKYYKIFDIATKKYIKVMINNENNSLLICGTASFFPEIIGKIHTDPNNNSIIRYYEMDDIIVRYNNHHIINNLLHPFTTTNEKEDFNKLYNNKKVIDDIDKDYFPATDAYTRKYFNNNNINNSLELFLNNKVVNYDIIKNEFALGYIKKVGEGPVKKIKEYLYLSNEIKLYRHSYPNLVFSLSKDIPITESNVFFSIGEINNLLPQYTLKYKYSKILDNRLVSELMIKLFSYYNAVDKMTLFKTIFPNKNYQIRYSLNEYICILKCELLSDIRVIISKVVKTYTNFNILFFNLYEWIYLKCTFVLNKDNFIIYNIGALGKTGTMIINDSLITIIFDNIHYHFNIYENSLIIPVMADNINVIPKYKTLYECVYSPFINIKINNYSEYDPVISTIERESKYIRADNEELIEIKRDYVKLYVFKYSSDCNVNCVMLNMCLYQLAGNISIVNRNSYKYYNINNEFFNDNVSIYDLYNTNKKDDQ